MRYVLHYDLKDLLRLHARMLQFAANEARPISQQIAIEDINLAAAKGVDPVTGRAHRPYTPEYAERRKKMGLQTSVVDLWVSGSLRGRGLGIIGDSVTVGERWKGQAAGLQKKRRWLAVGKPTTQRMGVELAKRMGNL